jgi:hypothetical protein
MPAILTRSAPMACKTNDTKLLDAALTAQNGLTKVYIQGDIAGACLQLLLLINVLLGTVCL